MEAIKKILSRYQWEEREVGLGEIKKELDIYPRLVVDRETVLRYRKAMEAGEKFPPIIISKDGVLIDGYHRVDAMKFLGMKEAKAIVILDELSPKEMFALAVEFNLRHGKRFEPRDFSRIKKIYTEQRIAYVFSDYLRKEIFEEAERTIQVVDNILEQIEREVEREDEERKAIFMEEEKKPEIWLDEGDEEEMRESKRRRKKDREERDEEEREEDIKKSLREEEVGEEEEVEREYGDGMGEEKEEEKEDEEDYRLLEEMFQGKKLDLYVKDFFEKVYMYVIYLEKKYKRKEIDERIESSVESVALRFISLGYAILREHAFYRKEKKVFDEFLKSLDFLRRGVVELGLDDGILQRVENSLYEMREMLP